MSAPIRPDALLLAPPLSDRFVLRTGQGVLGTALVVLLGSVFLMVTSDAGPAWLLLPAAVPCAVACLVVLFRHPLLNLAAVLTLSVFVFGSQRGFQATELLYAPYYLLFLLHYFVTRLLIYREPIAPHWSDKCLLVFFGGLACSIAVSILYGAKLDVFAKEAAAMAFLGFYFPIREAVATDRRAAPLLTGVLLWLMVFVAVRNLLNYESLLADAVLADVIGGRRVDTTNSVLMAGGIVVIGLLSMARRRLHLLGLLAVLTPVVMALAITQSRAAWVVLVMALGLAFLFGRGPQRRRIVVVTVLAVAALTAGFVVLVGDKATVIAASFTRRFLTLRSAAGARDISLLSRFYEAKAVWQHILQNPVLGYGLGVPYTYYEIISQTTMSKTFIHNGATALVYRYGVWGPPLILGTWLGALVRGYQAFRRTPDGSLEAALAFGCFLALTCLVVYSNTSNPFYQDDAVLMFALTAGLAAGLDARTRSRLAL